MQFSIQRLSGWRGLHDFTVLKLPYGSHQGKKATDASSAEETLWTKSCHPSPRSRQGWLSLLYQRLLHTFKVVQVCVLGSAAALPRASQGTRAGQFLHAHLRYLDPSWVLEASFRTWPDSRRAHRPLLSRKRRKKKKKIEEQGRKGGREERFRPPPSLASLALPPPAFPQGPSCVTARGAGPKRAGHWGTELRLKKLRAESLREITGSNPRKGPGNAPPVPVPPGASRRSRCYPPRPATLQGRKALWVSALTREGPAWGSGPPDPPFHERNLKLFRV